MFWLLRLPAMWKSLPNKFSKLWSWKILKRDGDCKPRQMMKLKGCSAVSHFPQNRFECLRMQFLDINYHVRLTCPILVPRSRLCHLLKGHIAQRYALSSKIPPSNFKSSNAQLKRRRV
uniref:Uncharacterized protein n=1 Tax=Opuntia streptacantha TaxID=393608 RepID=A0A7C9ANJ8_OPUST